MYGYDDSAERKIVRSFWDKTFNEQAVDTPDSWYHYFNEDIKALPGNVAIDLMVFNGNAYYGIEVEKMQETVYETAKATDYINIVLSKYFKYFQGRTNPNKMVFPIYSGNDYAGKLLVINGSDIYNYIDLRRTAVLDTDNNNKEVTLVAPMPIIYVKEYQFGQNRLSVKNTHSRVITVSPNVRNGWLGGEIKQRYSFQNADLMDFDKIRFKAYSKGAPFSEIGGFYEMSSSNVDRYKCNYDNLNDKPYKYILKSNVEKYGKYFPCNKGLN